MLLLSAACGADPIRVPLPAADAQAPPPATPHMMVDAVALGACGAVGEATTTLRNDGTGELTWSGAVSGIDGAFVEPKAGVLAAGSSAPLHLTVLPQPAGDPLTLTLTVMGNDPVQPRLDVPIQVRRSGAVLTLDSSSLDFGLIPVGVSPPAQTVVLRNDGNEPAKLSPWAAGGFAIAWDKAALAPTDTSKGTVTFSSKQLGVFTTVANIKVANACSDAPAVTLHAASVDGVVGISPGVLDLGKIACGTSTPTTGQITVYNVSKQPFTFTTAVLPGGTVDVQVSPAKVKLYGGSQQDIFITVPRVPAFAPVQKDYFAGAIQITTDAPKDAPHTVSVVATPSGGQLVLTGPPLVDFGKRELSAAPMVLGAGVQNVGNMPITLDGTIAAPFAVPGPLTLSAGASATFPVSHTPRPDVLGDVSAPLTFSTQDILCGPLPNTVVATVHTWEKAVSASARNLLDGKEQACAVGASGNVYCWGDNSHYQLGSNCPTSTQPCAVTGVTDAVSVATGGTAACAVTKTNEVWCWGDNGWGVLPNGVGPAKIGGITDATHVVVDRASCALRKGGGVACWGLLGYAGNGSGYGNGAITGPVAVANLPDAVALDGLFGETCAIRADQTIVCWGEDPWGGFGCSYFHLATTPVAVPGASGVVDLSVSGIGACFLTNGGSRYCWGAVISHNFSTSVVYEPGPPWFSSGLSSAGDTRCGLNPNATIECVGQGYAGVLGTGINGGWGDNVIGAGSFVSLGFTYALGIAPTGALLQWGRLLNTSTIVKPTPVPGFDP